MTSIVSNALSPRETEIIQHIASGRCLKEAAAAMGIAYSTTKIHAGSAVKRLGARTLPQAIAIAVRSGIV